ncbi:hypothetical protein EJ07DRAFT_182303 [Lizonia empirigonia]|nr:hypothetical protein EJ07DRAFT_182303 [Lizonia empirigonia]
MTMLVARAVSAHRFDFVQRSAHPPPSPAPSAVPPPPPSMLLPPPPPPPAPFPHPAPPFLAASAPPFPLGDSDMSNAPKSPLRSEETILFLFITFGILIVLILILLLLAFQTYLSHRVAQMLVWDDEDGAAGDFRAWDRARKERRKERRKALRALEKGRRVRGGWGFGSGSGSGSGSKGRPRTDEELGMMGARGSSLVLDKPSLSGEKEKRPFWSLKRWI